MNIIEKIDMYTKLTWQDPRFRFRVTYFHDELLKALQNNSISQAQYTSYTKKVMDKLNGGYLEDTLTTFRSMDKAIYGNEGFSFSYVKDLEMVLNARFICTSYVTQIEKLISDGLLEDRGLHALEFVVTKMLANAEKAMETKSGDIHEYCLELDKIFKITIANGRAFYPLVNETLKKYVKLRGELTDKLIPVYKSIGREVGNPAFLELLLMEQAYWEAITLSTVDLQKNHRRTMDELDARLFEKEIDEDYYTRVTGEANSLLSTFLKTSCDKFDSIILLYFQKSNNMGKGIFAFSKAEIMSDLTFAKSYIGYCTPNLMITQSLYNIRSYYKVLLRMEESPERLELERNALADYLNLFVRYKIVSENWAKELLSRYKG